MGDRMTLSRPGPLRAPGAAWIRAHGLEVALALPLVAYLLLLTAAPIVETLRLSVSAPLDGGFPSLGRYRALFASDLFRAALWNTVVVVVLSLGLEIGLGLLLALTLHRRFPLRGLVRTLVLMPLGVPTVVSAAVMLLVFGRSGHFNALLFAVADALGALGIEWRFEPVGWTVAGGFPTLVTLAVADTWKVLPVVTLILLAGLQAIPVEVEEAARADGATGWRWLRHVVLPHAGAVRDGGRDPAGDRRVPDLRSGAGLGGPGRARAGHVHLDPLRAARQRPLHGGGRRRRSLRPDPGLRGPLSSSGRSA